jgi:hypothetical protein
MLEILEYDLEKVLFGLVGDPEQRHPFRDSLMVDGERHGGRSRTTANQIFRKPVAVGVPFRFV